MSKQTPRNTPPADTPKVAENAVAPNVYTTPGGEETYHTDLPVGEVLRRARLHYGQSLEDVSRNIRIRVRQLDALEKGQWDALPGPVYAIGFVRSYAEYLRLDGARMVALFKAQAKGAGKPKPDLNFPVPADESTLPPWWIIAACVGVVVVALAFWLFSGGQSPPAVPDVPSPPPPPAAEAVVPPPPAPPAMPNPTLAVAPPTPAVPAAALPPAVAPDQSAPTPTPPAAPKGILLRVNIDSWVEIKDAGGAAIVARVLKKGEEYFVPNSPDLLMTLGNAGGVVLSVDGQDSAPLGAVGLVVRDVPLDIAGLVERYGKE